MPAISPKLSEFLIKTTKAKDIDDAFHKVFHEYLDLKLKRLRDENLRLQEKWGMDFDSFTKKLKNEKSRKKSYSFDIEQDFWFWEETVTLLKHYENLKNEWI